MVDVDPAEGNWDGMPKADLILVTDIHDDHMSPALIGKLKKPGTTIISPAAVAKTVTEAAVLHNGETKTVGAWNIEAVPMYNLKRGPGPGQLFHDKGRGNGYIVTYGGLRIYIAGDTEVIPEMRALKNIDVAFVPDSNLSRMASCRRRKRRKACACSIRRLSIRTTTWART